MHAQGNQIHGHGVVIDHEYFERLVLDPTKQTYFDERVVQRLARDRLLQDRGGAKGHSLANIRDNREDYDGDALQLRYLFEARKQFPAI